MSEPKAVSPLLDGISIGQKISDHSGIRCYAAMNTDTREKFILKHISIPESQVRVEALILTGACADNADALSYYTTVAEDLKTELAALSKVAESRKFLPYIGYQIEEKKEGIGFDAYILGTYRRSLAAFTKKNALTHLFAVNLALDLCAALSACRQAGYLYVNLKPDNIFLQGESSVIGDLGFVDLGTLSYASFPDRYWSDYTAPEMQEIFAPINKTIDIYALGLVLYQIYNGGRLPFEDEGDAASALDRRQKGEAFPAPIFADYEMAEIILKACAFRPEDRWQSPEEMGQALMGYMQRNEVTDSIIAPPIVTDLPLDTAGMEDSSDIPTEEPPQEELPQDEDTQEEAPTEDTPEEDSEEARIASMSLEELLKDVASQLDTPTEALPEEEPAPAPMDPDTAEEISAMLESQDESAPSEKDADPGAVTDEFSDVMAQANDLIQHAEEVAKAEEDARRQAQEAQEAQERAEREAVEKARQEAEALEKAQREAQEKADREALAKEKKERNRGRKNALITTLVVLLILALLGGGAYYYYRNYYCLNISGMEIVESSQESLTVAVDTDEDPSTLLIRCTDTYGNAQEGTLVDGRVTFTGLTPDNQYTVTAVAQGFHKLTSTIQVSYTTNPTTEVTNLVALAGQEDGSVILNLTVNGPEPSQWSVTYSADGEASQTQAFSSHMVTVSGLTIGKTYTFQLSAGPDIALTGSTSLDFTATEVITAQDLAIAAYENGNLTVTWDQPQTPVSAWSVRCYNDSGYDTTQDVTDCTATFEGLDPTSAYTVEVTASGMTLGTHIYVSENPVVITGAQLVAVEDSSDLEVRWDYTGAAPAGGWILLYAFGEGENAMEVAQSETNSVRLSGLIPNATYSFQIQTAQSTTVFDGTFTASTPAPAAFSGYGITGDNIYMAMYPTPDKEDWTFKDDVFARDYTTTFSVNDPIAFVLQISTDFQTSEDIVTTTCVVRDQAGNVVDYYTGDEAWYAMWTESIYVSDLERTPQTPGEYTLEIYFNNALAKTMDFTVTE